METTGTIQQELSQPEAVATVRGWLKRNEGGSRVALARHVCKELGLRDRQGKPRLAGTQKALRVLEGRGYWKLPEPKGASGKTWRPRRLNESVTEVEGVPSRVEAVRGLQLVQVSSADDDHFRIWNELILSEHPLHDCRLVGRQLRYLIGSEHGWLGAIGFGSCALRLSQRDEWIGWDEPRRKQFQERLINLTRFLIRPQVRCENLASRVLKLCLERVGDDFERSYGFEPWLVETFVDSRHYTGTCFRAANWMCLGVSRGRGRSAPTKPMISPKEIYLYPLNRDWRRRMGMAERSEAIAQVDLEEALNSQGWVEAEFGGVDFGHQAPEQRLLQIAEARAQHPCGTTAECFLGNRHQLKAYYRFIGNQREQITVPAILKSHCERTMGRMKGCKRVLVIQDTTDLDFSKRLRCNDLGAIGKNQTGSVSQGLKMHSSLAVSEQGLPFGVLDTQIYASHYGEEKSTDRPIEEKESYRWLQTIERVKELSGSLEQTELICVGDRESDIFELFDYRRRKAGSIHVLVRSQYNRCLEDESSKLFDHLESLPVMGQAEISIPRQRERKSKPSKPGRIALPARAAQVQLKWDKVSIAAPQTKQTRHLPAAELYALSIVEPDPPKEATPIRWFLLTTFPVLSRKQALRCLGWYTKRWRIEEWHRVLKSGCNIEAHQHRSAHKLARAIAIDTVIAWRVMLLTLLGREVPEIPAEVVFSTWECRLLKVLQMKVAPETLADQKKGASTSASPALSSLDSAVP